MKTKQELSIYEVLNISTTLGFDILSYGAETYRVEESIKRLCNAYGYEKADVFAIPSSIVVTVEDDNGKFMTKTRRVLNRVTDLDKIDKLNNLCRYICAETPDYDMVIQKIEAIRVQPVYSFEMQVFGYGLISAFFCLFYGGDLGDALSSFAIGIALKLLLRSMERMGSSGFFMNIVGSSIVAFLSDLAVTFGFASNMDKMIIGIIMNLVPGIALTNSMREFISGDIISGMIKLSEALIVALGIAIGVLLSLAYFTPLMGRFFSV